MSGTGLRSQVTSSTQPFTSPWIRRQEKEEEEEEEEKDRDMDMDMVRGSVLDMNNKLKLENWELLRENHKLNGELRVLKESMEELKVQFEEKMNQLRAENEMLKNHRKSQSEDGQEADAEEGETEEGAIRGQDDRKRDRKRKSKRKKKKRHSVEANGEGIVDEPHPHPHPNPRTSPSRDSSSSSPETGSRQRNHSQAKSGTDPLLTGSSQQWSGLIRVKTEPGTEPVQPMRSKRPKPVVLPSVPEPPAPEHAPDLRRVKQEPVDDALYDEDTLSE
jgi:hypothetical protein